MQLLEIIQRTVRRLPLTNAVTSVIGTSSQIILQLLEIAQEDGDELVGRHEWQALQRTFSFVGAGGNPDSTALPSDWSRFKSDASFWRSGSFLSPLAGPTSSDGWHIVSATLGVRLPGYWRIEAGNLLAYGVPSGETVSIPYISTKWILDVDGVTTKAFWTADTDSPRLAEGLIRSGIRWRWKQTKGLDYAEDMKSYELELERRIAADRAARPIPLSWVVQQSHFGDPEYGSGDVTVTPTFDSG